MNLDLAFKQVRRGAASEFLSAEFLWGRLTRGLVVPPSRAHVQRPRGWIGRRGGRGEEDEGWGVSGIREAGSVGG